MGNPYSNLEDSKLMKLYLDEDHLAFNVIYYRYKDQVYSYLNKRLIDKQHIDDIFQNIFIKFHNSKKLYNFKYPLLQWIYIISRSEFLDYLKKKKNKSN